MKGQDPILRRYSSCYLSQGPLPVPPFTLTPLRAGGRLLSGLLRFSGAPAGGGARVLYGEVGQWHGEEEGDQMRVRHRLDRRQVYREAAFGVHGRLRLLGGLRAGVCPRDDSGPSLGPNSCLF